MGPFGVAKAHAAMMETTLIRVVLSLPAPSRVWSVTATHLSFEVFHVFKPLFYFQALAFNDHLLQL
jgi:hypothetical protein